MRTSNRARWKRSAGAAIAALTLLGCGATERAPARSPEAPAHAMTLATASRPPRGAAEQEVASRVVFDPALDCVAARAAIARRDLDAEPWRVRHEWPIGCGSPAYVLAAREVPASPELGRSLVDFASALGGSGPITLGVAPVPETSSVMVVGARRVLEIEPFSRRGGGVLRGRVNTAGEIVEAYISTTAGTTRVAVPLAAGRFEVDLTAFPNARVELAARRGQESEPLGRFDLGGGADPLIGADARSGASFFATINAERRRVGLPTLESGTTAGDCDAIPARSGDNDVSDRAWCFSVPRLGMAALAREVAYRPMLLHRLLEPAVTTLELSEEKGAVSARALRRFEVLAPDAGRRRVIAALRERWPDLREQLAPRDALAEILAEWAPSAEPGPSAVALKPRLDRIAGAWTRTKRFYTALLTGRDVEAALAMIQPESPPRAVDAALVQVRGPDGAMRHLIAVTLEMP